MTESEIESVAGQCASDILAAHAAASKALTDPLRTEIARLRSAGDALADAIVGRWRDDPDTWREQLNSALAAWEAARDPETPRR